MFLYKTAFQDDPSGVHNAPSPLPLRELSFGNVSCHFPVFTQHPTTPLRKRSYKQLSPTWQTSHLRVFSIVFQTPGEYKMNRIRIRSLSRPSDYGSGHGYEIVAGVPLKVRLVGEADAR
ncbi:hypothetical protein TNCV_1430821 [Trichonephila clavipes]|nr:hypothetical protein TNCV_1430821 [Trichonephila clavipes]